MPLLRLFWALAVVSAAVAGVGCPDEQPPECKAALDCLYPDGEFHPNSDFRNRYAQCAEDPYSTDDAGNTPNRDVTLKVLGENGECWAIEDGYYEACRLSCLTVLRDDCARPQNFCEDAMLGSMGRTCEDLREPDSGVNVQTVRCTFLEGVGNPQPDPTPDPTPDPMPDLDAGSLDGGS